MDGTLQEKLLMATAVTMSMIACALKGRDRSIPHEKNKTCLNVEIAEYNVMKKFTLTKYILIMDKHLYMLFKFTYYYNCICYYMIMNLFCKLIKALKLAFILFLCF